MEFIWDVLYKNSRWIRVPNFFISKLQTQYRWEKEKKSAKVRIIA